MARKKPAPTDHSPSINDLDDATKATMLAGNVGQLAELAAKILVAAGELGIKNKPLQHFWLAPAQRDVLRTVPVILKSFKDKLANERESFTLAEVASMTMYLAEASTGCEPRKQMAFLLVAKHLTIRLQEGILLMGKSPSRKASGSKIKADRNTLYQFKITLIGSTPPIWRRIQVTDCKLDKLHEYIQTSMGWSNSHLHQFEIDGVRYGNPELLDDGFAEFDCKDSTRTRISQIVPKSGERFSFTYEYDFGDGWRHEIVFEGCPLKEPNEKYPRCLEGERACPPEDVGGIRSFYVFLKALADPKHEQHDNFIEWVGDFDPNSFDSEKATKAMRVGLPDLPW